MEYSFSPHKLVHFSIPVTIGGGHASVDSVNAVLSNYNGDDHHGRNGRHSARNANEFAFIQPALNVDVNVFKYGKWFVGAGCRINVYANENTAALVNLTNTNLSGLSFQTGLKLGIFGINIRKKPKDI